MGRHLFRAMPHLLTDDGGIQTGQLPPSVAAMTKGVQASSRQTECPQSRVQAIMQHIVFAEWSIVPGMENKSVGIRLRMFFQEVPQRLQRFFPLGVVQ